MYESRACSLARALSAAHVESPCVQHRLLRFEASDTHQSTHKREVYRRELQIESLENLCMCNHAVNKGYKAQANMKGHVCPTFPRVDHPPFPHPNPSTV